VCGMEATLQQNIYIYIYIYIKGLLTVPDGEEVFGDERGVVGGRSLTLSHIWSLSLSLCLSHTRTHAHTHTHTLSLPPPSLPRHLMERRCSATREGITLEKHQACGV